MSVDEDRSIFIKCACHGEGMGVDYDSEDGHYYFSYWNCGLSNKTLSWKARLRYCWNTLTKGKAFNDEIMLDQKSTDKLIDFLLGHKRLSREQMDKLVGAINEAFKKNRKDG